MSGQRRRSLVIALGLAGAALALAWPSSAQSPGAAERGRTLFSTKQCGRCHAPRGQAGRGPAVEELRKAQGVYELAGRLWNHAPAMFVSLREEGVAWPEITAEEMADLMVYLQASPARDTAPDVARGQALLLRKGCLKCHRFRGEGRPVGIDLTQPRPGYDSPVMWAVTVWSHAPRMAVEARQMGVLYPRFSDDEMGNLVGFLRSSVKSQ
jgi:mono/diheme cytochrome c family protein